MVLFEWYMIFTLNTINSSVLIIITTVYSNYDINDEMLCYVVAVIRFIFGDVRVYLLGYLFSATAILGIMNYSITLYFWFNYVYYVD